jgi:hypothetical protein
MAMYRAAGLNIFCRIRPKPTLAISPLNNQENLVRREASTLLLREPN